jgi:myo-inositol 2-dehydrogenase/D-chiro-inositol 1-dehydrogenase
MRAYSIEWNAFVDAITSGSALPVSLDDGVNALALAEAATRSLASGQSVSLAEIL